MRGRALVGWRLQVAVLLVAGGLWSIYPHASLAALVVAYLLAWGLLNYLRASRWVLPPRAAVAISLILAAAPIARAWELARRFAENEGLDGVGHLTESRRALLETPSIHPRLLSLDRPETFYVHAPDAHEVDVDLGEGRPDTRVTALGHGLFRVETHPLDPGTRGALGLEEADEGGARSGTLEALLRVDGETHRRPMRWVRPHAHPRWLAPSPSRDRAAAVSEETDELFVVGVEGAPLTRPTDDGPVGVVFTSETEVAIAHRYAETILFLDPTDPEAPPRALPIGPWAVRIAVSEDRSRLVVARDGAAPQLVLVDPNERRVLRRIPLGFSPDWVAFGPDANTLVVSSRRPAALHRFVDGSPAGEPIALSRPVVTMSAGGPVIVASVTDYQPDGREHLGNHFVEDHLITIDVAGWRVIDARPTATRTERQRSPGNVDRGVSPMGIDLAPDGSVWVAFAGTDDVFRYQPDAVRPRVIGLDEQPLASPCSAVALASDQLAISSPVYGAIGLFDADGERVSLARFAPDDQTLLREDEDSLKRRIGERTFYESTRAGVSCQSCHLHGGSDGARHNIGGTTFVATLDTRGAADTPPYLRDGGYPTLGSLDDVAQTLYRGYRRRQGGRRPGLDAYLSSLAREPPRRQLEGRDLPRERRGLDAFVKARCVVCHAFPAFTNLSSHQAAWLFEEAEGIAAHELDTPSLLGLDRSAPYLVDGRAETVEAVLTEHDTPRHGDTSALSERERADLVHLLEGL